MKVRIPRLTRILALAGVAAAAVGAVAAPAIGAVGVAAPSASASHLLWKDCGGGFQCATTRVPLDYGDPSGTQISIALIKLPATDPRHRIGTMFVNPGGPGGSGVDFVRSFATALWPASVRARFDIVGFDPRGVGRSSPIRCFATQGDEARFLAGLPPFPVGRAQQAALAAKVAEFGAICARHNAAIMQHMSTADVARDLNLLRQRIGDARLTYYGVSYGTYLGLTYANLFPRRVRAIVIDGVLDPVAWATGRGDTAATQPYSTREQGAEGSTATFGQFLSLCDRAGAGCAFSGGSAAKFAALTSRAKRHPIVIPGPAGSVTISYADIISLVRPALEDARNWPGLATTLQQLYLASSPANPVAMPPSAAEALIRAASAPYDNMVDAQTAVACTDTDNPHNPAAWPRAAAAADRSYPYFGAIWTYDSAACASWPASDADRYSGPFTRHISAPVLVVGNVFDPDTRYQNAQIVARETPGARLLTLDGWGHTSLGKSSCVSDYVARYLIGLALPAAGTVCASDQMPFGLPAPPAPDAARAS